MLGNVEAGELINCWRYFLIFDCVMRFPFMDVHVYIQARAIFAWNYGADNIKGMQLVRTFFFG